MWLQDFDRRRASPAQVALVEAAAILLKIPAVAAADGQQKVDYAATAQALAQDFYGSLARIVDSAESLSDEDALRLGRVLQRGGFSFEAIFRAGGITRELHDAVMYVVRRLSQQKNRIPVTVDHVAVAMDGSMLSYAALDAAAHIRKHGKLLIVHIANDEEMPPTAREHLVTDVKRRCKHQYKIPDDMVEVIVTSSVADDSRESENKGSTDLNLHHLQASKLQEILTENNVRVLALGMQGQHKTFGLGRLASWAANSVHQFSCVLAKPSSPKCALNEQRIPYKFLMPLPSQLQSPERFEQFWMNSLAIMHPGDSLVLLCLQESSNEGEENGKREEFGIILHELAGNATIDAVVRHHALEQQCTAAQEALRVIEQEDMDAVLLPKIATEALPHVTECLQAARCTVIVV